jgi:hypothetical protein
VRKCQLLYQPSVLLLAVLPVFGTIAPVQNNAKWNSGAATTCVVTLTSAPVQYHLLVVWTYWKTSTANTLTASVSDSQGNGIGTPAVFPSAVQKTWGQTGLTLVSLTRQIRGTSRLEAVKKLPFGQPADASYLKCF